jgi:DNA-binding NarL/FixJ family response regulator
MRDSQNSELHAQLFALLIDEGLNQKAISERTGMPSQTVHGHLRIAAAMLHAKSLEQACVYWDRQRTSSENKQSAHSPLFSYPGSNL